MTRVEGFDFVHRETVRFRDVDSMGHVNNAVYLTYLEQARLAFLARLTPPARPREVILARVEIDFRSPAKAGDEVEIGVRPARLGTKSVELEHELRVDGQLVAEARDVVVAFDYESGKTKAIPAEWQTLLAARGASELKLHLTQARR
jgi:acyl-CoA thioester hydrolase